MSHHLSRRTPGGPAFVKSLRAARRVSMIIGLALATLVAAALYLLLFRQHAHTSHRVATHKAMTLHRLAKFKIAGVPSSVHLDPSGKIVIVVADNKYVTAWSTTSGRRRHTFSAIPDKSPIRYRYLTSPTFSPDGREFSVLDQGGFLDVWDVTTGRATSVADTPEAPWYATLGPNGLVAESDSGRILVLTVKPMGPPELILPVDRAGGIGYQISEPAFSPDGQTIAVSDVLGKIHLANVPGKRLTMAFTAEKIYNPNINGMSTIDIDSLTFSQDSKLLACGSEGGIIRIWDVVTGRNVSTFSINSSGSGNTAARPVKTLVFSPDGKTLATSDNADSALTIWDTASGHKVVTLTAGTGNVASAVFAPNGTLIVATTSSRAPGHGIQIWATGRIPATNLVPPEQR